MIVVSNAGPLIALAQIGQFNLLRMLYGQLYIPVAVHTEVAASGYKRPGGEELRASTWIHITEISELIAIPLLKERLDAGESEAIALALQLGADLLLMDEGRGRRVAEARGLHKTGTIGTLIAAKKRVLVPEVTVLLDALWAAGFRMSENLYRTAQRLAGEA